MKNSIRKTAWAALLAGTTALTAFAPQAGAQSLEDELSGLLADHPQIKAARENVAAAEEGRNQEFADYLPKVQATGNFGYERIDSPGRRTATDPVAQPFTTGQARTASVTITQTLFNGFRSDANNAAAASAKDAAEEAAETSVQGILFEAVSAYLEVMRNMRLVRLAGDNEDTIRLQLQLEDERVRRGAGIAVDVLQAKSRLQVAKERRVAFNGALDDSISRYNQVFGHMPDTRELIMPTPPLGLLPETTEDMIAIALDEHPAIRSATAQIDIANEQRRIAQADFFPTIDISGEWSYDDDLNGTRGTQRDYKAKVNASWTLFNGFATRASVAQAAHTYRSTIDSGAFVKRKITEEVQLAWSGLDIARQRVVLLQNAVNIASEVFSARRKLREAGKETVINVLDAESEMFNARINLVAAQHDARVAVYRLMLSMGRLTLENAGNLAQSSRATTLDANIEALPTGENTDEPARESNDDSAAAAPELTEETPAPQAKADVEPVVAKAATVVASANTSETDVAALATPAQTNVVADTTPATPERKLESEAVTALKVSEAVAIEALVESEVRAEVDQVVAPVEPEAVVAVLSGLADDALAPVELVAPEPVLAPVMTRDTPTPQDSRDAALDSPDTDRVGSTLVRPVMKASLRLDPSLPTSDEANFLRLWPYE